MKRYEKYKDSGVEWIGEIPEGWTKARLKYKLHLINGRAFLQPEFQEEGKYRILRVGNFFTNSTWYYSDMELDPIKYCDTGDLLYAWSTSFGPYIWKEEKVIYHYHIWKVLLENDYDKMYAYYMLQALTDFKKADIHGSTMVHVTMESMNSTFIPLPSFSEQQSIANYLDAKCGKIDKVIAVQEKRVELLRELKQSIITRAVTRGIPSTSSGQAQAKMKDSGVEWIGEIPEHWEVIKVKQIARITNGSDPKTDGDTPVYGSGACSFKTCGEYKIGPCVLLGRKGATLHIPHYIDGKYWNVDTAFDVKTIGSFNLKLFYYLAGLFDYGYYTMTTTLPSMTQTDYGNMKIPLPPLAEQQQIVTYIEQQTSRLDSSIAKALRQIELLKEYKQSLITEVVTGKRKVV